MPSVLLIPDRPGWAYDILAQQLKVHLVDWDVDIKYIVEFRDNVDSIDFSDYDVVFFFLWYDAMRYGRRVKGFDFQKTCVGVHSIASWKKRGIPAKFAALVCNQFAATGVISEELNSLLALHRPFMTPNGIDQNLFTLAKPPTLEPLRFMWVGNPNLNHHGDNKGFESIIAPVFDSLDKQVELVTATPSNPILRKDMGEFYASGHILLCMSENEGGPLPVLEAMHVGRPVISTSVGIVPEVVVNDVNGWIIERSRSALKSTILKLLENKECLENMWGAAHTGVVGRSSVKMADLYNKMFSYVLKEGGGLDKENSSNS
ncbi:MAG: hypothetical protein CMA10_00470 [Euryarchaeota archaeon]|nr:hypothetical protein [Euryarchaeota archaeon]